MTNNTISDLASQLAIARDELQTDIDALIDQHGAICRAIAALEDDGNHGGGAA